jgi:hypothetical protein
MFLLWYWPQLQFCWGLLFGRNNLQPGSATGGLLAVAILCFLYFGAPLRDILFSVGWRSNHAESLGIRAECG